MVDPVTSLGSSSVTTAALAANAVTSAKMATGAAAGNLAAGDVTPTMLAQKLTQGSAQATTSGTSIDFTSIPSWVKRITVMFNGVSLSGTAVPRIQLGVGGTPETTGYNSVGSYISAFGPSANVAAATSGFDTNAGGGATFNFYGAVTLINVTGNVWVVTGAVSNNVTTVFTSFFSGQKSLAGVLNMVRITSTNGTDTFDAGSVNIIYE